MPIIPVIVEVELEGSWSKASPSQELETLPEKQLKQKRTGGVIQCFPSKLKALKL
jgi:hypothetical protein